MCFFVQTNHTRKELLFLMFKEINLRNHSSLHKLFYSLKIAISIWLICTIASIILDVLVKAINDISVAQSLALIGGGIKIIGLISLLGIFVVPFFKHNENQ